MTATLRRLFIAIPATLLFSASCWAQLTIIEGDVKGLDGKPLKDAVVKIERKDQKGNYKTKSDKKGHYVYTGLPIGSFVVTLEVDGKDVDRAEIKRTSTSENSVINFDMKDLAARQAAANAAASSGAGATGLTKEQERSMTPEQKAAYEKNLKDKSAQLTKQKELNEAFNAGVEAQTAKNYDAAITSYEKASTLDPAQHVVWGRLGDSYSALAKTKAGSDRDQLLDKANAAYLKAIEIKPDATEYHINYAISLANAKKIPEAQAELAKAIALDPTQAGKCYYNLGAVLTNTGQTDAALEAFKKAIDADPNYADAYYQYGITLMAKVTIGADGKMIAAPGTSEAFNKYLQLAPDGPNAATAKEMITSLGATIDTGFNKPGDKKNTATKKKP
jgi:tetratricopeptide (TPR) repeat protein